MHEESHRSGWTRDSACRYQQSLEFLYLALFNMIVELKKNIEHHISLGGGATVDKVGTKWPHIDEVYDGVLQHLTARMTTSQPTVRSYCKSS
jgi:hypothetical protein